MERKVFESHQDLVAHIAKRFNFEKVDIVCFYEDAREFVDELVRTGLCSVANIDLQEFDVNGYDKEYLVSLCNFEDECELWVQPAFDEKANIYYLTEADVAYVLDDCSSHVLPKIRASEIFEVCLDPKEYCDEYYDECCAACAYTCEMAEDDFDDNDEYHTCMSSFTVSKHDDSFYHSISVHSTDQGFLKEMMRQFKDM